MFTFKNREIRKGLIAIGLACLLVPVSFSAQAMKLGGDNSNKFSASNHIVNIATNPHIKYRVVTSRARVRIQKLKNIVRRIKRINSSLQREVMKSK